MLDLGLRRGGTKEVIQIWWINLQVTACLPLGVLRRCASRNDARDGQSGFRPI
jgi:hypothetical protein